MKYDHYIKDIRFGSRSGIEIVPKLTATMVEGKVREMKYEVIPHDPRIDLIKIPATAIPFFLWVALRDDVPSQKELVSYYKGWVTGRIKFATKDIKLPDYSDEVIRFRVSKAHPSLVRDLHFYLMCKEYGLDVEYSTKKDVVDSIDLTAKIGEVTTEVALCIDTDRAVAHRSRKARENPPDFTIYLNLAEANKFGDYYLYSREDVRTLADGLRVKASIDAIRD